MTRLRIGLAVTAALVTLGATASQAATGATGGGFSREGSGRNATKTSLTVQAQDATTDSGSADYHVTRPGTSSAVTRITLSCVVVAGTTAYASGRDGANQWYLVKVVDNGEPGKRDAFGVQRTSAPPTSLLPWPMPVVRNCGASDVATKTLTGGNFQVR